MYLDFETYQNMGGELVETTFNEYEFAAETVVDWYTFNRLKTGTIGAEVEPRLQRLMFALIKMIAVKMNTIANNFVDADGNVVTGAVTQQANDGVSISFNSLSATNILEATKDSALGELVHKYLAGYKNSLGRSLTYRGLYPGE